MGRARAGQLGAGPSPDGVRRPDAATRAPLHSDENETVTTPLIPAGGVYPLVWLFLAIIALTLFLERTRLKKYMPGPALVIVIPCALANFGVIPRAAPEYDVLYQFTVPVGVSLLLLRADVAEILRNSGSMLGYFFLGVLASYLGIVVALMVFDFGPHQADIATVMVAYLTGSTVNVVAAAQAVRMDPTFLTAAIAGCAIALPTYLAVATYVMRSQAVGRFLRAAPGSSYRPVEAPEPRQTSSAPAVAKPPLGVLFAALYALGVYVVVDAIMRAMGQGHLTILAITLVAIVIPNVFPPIRNVMSGDREMGLIVMFLFICAIAAQIDVISMGYQGLRVALFAALVLLVHVIVMLIGGRLMRADPHLLFLASLCGVGGPPSVAAVAAAQGREDLVTPAILCGLAGIILGTFVAVASYQLMT